MAFRQFRTCATESELPSSARKPNTSIAMLPTPNNRKVLFIGWDAADWKVITPLMDSGLMPSLESLVNRGVMGNLATLDPPLSPMLWTSIATGHTADKHGILGFLQPTPDGMGVRPVLGTSRKVKAIWNILNQVGKKTNVVGWWPSHPAERVDGVTVSNFYHRSVGVTPDEWDVPPGTIHPAELSDALKDFRVHVSELTAAHLTPFVPSIEEVDPLVDLRGTQIARMIAEAATTHATITWLLDNTEWDFSAVYLDTVDHFGHGFMKFHPPQLPNVPPALFERYKGAVAACYRFHDMMLGQLLMQVDDDTTVIVMSDHGFHSDHLRPLSLPKEPAGPAYEHRQHGVFVMAGPGIKKDERVFGATLLDITPTLLALYGLPVGRDMKGQPLVQAFENSPEIEYVDTWESIDEGDKRSAASAKIDPWAEQESMKQLIELGYIDAPEGTSADQVDKTVRESKFYLSRVYFSTNRVEKALDLLKQIHGEEPSTSRYAIWLLKCHQELKNTNEAFEMLAKVRMILAEHKQKYEERKSKLLENAVKFGYGPGDRTRHDGAEYTPSDGRLDLIEGSLHLEQGEIDTALACLRRAEKADPNLPALHNRIGEAFLRAKKWEDAERSFQKSLTIDPNDADGHRGLALSLLRRDLYEQAAEAALRAVGFRHFFPAAHFHLGEALMRLGMFERAAEAFEVAVKQAPGIRRAHFFLVQLYRQHLEEPAKAQAHEEFMEKRIRPATAVA